ncbi:MAG: DUF1109 domain-containing protein [Acidobacteria bacterium]|nr:DUF1109 domain-containing protein [Acidobacteriota bacterium]MCA1649521.1 DUF1109 domain-containing protein [Acidobacteriota bacterium]
MNTERLIDTLADTVAPTRPLADPWIRSTAWLVGTLVYFGALVLMMAPVSEIAANARGGLFVFQQLAAGATAATAAGAAFALTVPGYPRGLLRLAAITAFVWVGSLSLGAMHEWTRHDMNLAASGELACVALIGVAGAIPGLTMARMLRRGAPLAPGLTTGLAALAITVPASLAACMARPHPSDAVTLAWHGTAIVILVALAASAGHAVLSWKIRTARSAEH